MRRLQSSPWTNFAAGALTILALATILSVAGVVLADPPSPDAQAPEGVVDRQLHIQGRLTDAAGVPINGARNLTMTLYTASSGGAIVCRDANNATTVSNGLFEFTMDGCAANELNGQELWLAVQVGGLPEMTPRQEVLPVPYAYTVVPGAYIGGSGAGDGSLYLYQADGSGTIDLTSVDGGDINLRNAAGTRTIWLHGAPGAIYLGANGEDGDIVVYDTNGVSDTFTVDGAGGTVWIGGLGENGALFVRDSAGVSVFDFDASNGELELGGNGEDGDIRVNNSTDVGTFTVDGATGGVYAKGNVTQDRPSYGLVKAGVLATCSDTSPVIVRSFGGVSGISAGAGPGQCTISFDSRVDDRYYLAMPQSTGPDLDAACSSTGLTGHDLGCVRFDSSTGTGSNGTIMVLVF